MIKIPKFVLFLLVVVPAIMIVLLCTLPTPIPADSILIPKAEYEATLSCLTVIRSMPYRVPPQKDYQKMFGITKPMPIQDVCAIRHIQIGLTLIDLEIPEKHFQKCCVGDVCTTLYVENDLDCENVKIEFKELKAPDNKDKK